MIWGIATAHPPMEGQEVDRKRLVQFALLGSSDLEQYAILLVRVSHGLFDGTHVFAPDVLGASWT